MQLQLSAQYPVYALHQRGRSGGVPGALLVIRNLGPDKVRVDSALVACVRRIPGYSVDYFDIFISGAERGQFFFERSALERFAGIQHWSLC